MVRRIVAPPASPGAVGPGAAHRTEHVATEDEGAKLVHRPVGEFVVYIANSSPLLSVHGAEGPGMKEPLKNLAPAPTKWITEVLLDPGAETVQRKAKSCDTNF